MHKEIVQSGLCYLGLVMNNWFCVYRYLYCDEISLEADTVLPTLYAAKKYIIPHLTQACTEYLEANLDASNVCLLLSHSLLFEESALTQRCWNTIEAQAEEVLKSDSFTDIDFQTLEKILSHDTLDAEESAVFVASTRWAVAECTRQGRDTSPQQCRDVLGDALYLLRLPTMTPRDFADGAAKSGLLGMKETLDLLLYFTASDKPELRFPTTCRKKHLRRCHRFNSISKGNWNYRGVRDSIQFSVDKGISVAGYGLYGSRVDSVEYRLTIELKCQDLPLRCKSHRILSDGSSKMFDVLFDSPCRIEANTYYTANLYVEKTERNGYNGKNGMACVTCDGISFTFKDSPEDQDETDVKGGVIPEILFHCWHLISLHWTCRLAAIPGASILMPFHLCRIVVINSFDMRGLMCLF